MYTSGKCPTLHVVQPSITYSVSPSNAVNHISGAGIQPDKAAPQYEGRPIANNGLILSASNGMSVNFISNSSHLGVGVVTLPDGRTRSSGGYIDVWRVYSPFDRPGTLRIETFSSLPSTRQGIYITTIPDSYNNMFKLNVGLYPSGFNGELLLLIHKCHYLLYLSPYNSGSHHFQPDIQLCTPYSDL